MVQVVAVSGYRSLRDLVVPFGQLTVVCGANGSGKSSLYRSLRLLAAAAEGRLIPALAGEGGLASALSAGIRYPANQPKRPEPTALRLGFAGGPFNYAVDLGIPACGDAAFDHDPVIKRETIWVGPKLRPSAILVDRGGPLVRVRGEGRELEELSRSLPAQDSVLADLADPERTPEVFELRRQIGAWRFYDHLRTDPDAPARRPCVATTTNVLAGDGADLAAALETIRWHRDPRLQAAIDAAFPGAVVDISVGPSWADVMFREAGVPRPMRAQELSEGTLRYLLLVAALLSPRPPQLLVLNEPETSLHPQLIGPLARLIEQAAEVSQVVVVTHAQALVDGLRRARVCRLVKNDGDTEIEGQGLLDRPFWTWPKR